MKALYWFLTFLFGARGVLSLLRGLELLIFAGRLRLGVLLSEILALALAARCRAKARSLQPSHFLPVFSVSSAVSVSIPKRP